MSVAEFYDKYPSVIVQTQSDVYKLEATDYRRHHVLGTVRELIMLFAQLLLFSDQTGKIHHSHKWSSADPRR